MTKPNSTELVLIVDRSGSMDVIAEAMSQGFNEFIRKQKQVPGECKVTVVQFDDRYDVLYTALPLDQVPSYTLRPGGSTALLDAVGKTILETGQRLAAMKEEDRPSQVLFVIITDGMENASREFTHARVFEMITHQRDKYAWEFVYLGANQDAIAVGRSLGVSGTNAVTYEATERGVHGLVDAMSTNLESYRGRGVGRMENLFNQESYDKGMSKPQEPPKK